MSILDDIANQPPLSLEHLEATLKRIQETRYDGRPHPVYRSPREQAALQAIADAEKNFRKGKSPLYLAGYDKGREDRFDLAKSARREQAHLRSALTTIGRALGLSYDVYAQQAGEYSETPDYDDWLVAQIVARVPEGGV